MAYNTYYTVSLTTLEGNTLTYNLDKYEFPDPGTVTPSFLNITENSYEFEYFFNDVDGANLGIGYLSKIITLEFFGDTEINLIKSDPEDWRLTITLDGDSIFVGFPDVKSIKEGVLPNYSDIYQCDFRNRYALVSNNNDIYSDVLSSHNDGDVGVHFSNSVPISDLFSEFISSGAGVRNTTGLSKDCFISHDWVSENSISTVAYPSNPNLRLISVRHDTAETLGELMAQICKGWMLRVGYSYTEGKTLILHHLAGASGNLSGSNCAYVSFPSVGYRGRVSATINLQTLQTDGSDFIVKGDVNSENIIFPRMIVSKIGSTLENDFSSINHNNSTSYISFFDENYEIESWWNDNVLCTTNSEPNGITVLSGVTYPNNDISQPPSSFQHDVLEEVKNVNPSNSTELYKLNKAVGKRTGTDYLFGEEGLSLKSFRVKINKILDPIIPISWNSKVWITSSGTVNLYEETMECLLVEIQDNG